MFDWLRRLLNMDRPNWEQRVDFWPKEYPHRIVTWADVAMLKSIMVHGGTGCDTGEASRCGLFPQLQVGQCAHLVVGG